RASHCTKQQTAKPEGERIAQYLRLIAGCSTLPSLPLQEGVDTLAIAELLIELDKQQPDFLFLLPQPVLEHTAVMPRWVATQGDERRFKQRELFADRRHPLLHCLARPT